MKYLQAKYIRMMNLPLINQTGENWNFRCVVCGDSKKNPYKKRGWFKWYRDSNHFNYYCFNCNASMGFDKFIKEYYPDLHAMYTIEKKDQTLSTFTQPTINNELYRPVLVSSVIEKGAEPLDECKEALDYVQSRNTPYAIYTKWYYIRKYNKIEVLIPFYKGDKIYGYQKRNIKEKTFYIELPEENIKIWNWYNIVSLYPVYFTESVFDSAVFYNLDSINNNPVQSIALIGKSINSKIINAIYNLKDRITFCFDNDIPGKASVKKYSKIFPYAKFLYWDEKIKCKDLNELYNKGGKENFKKYIENYTLSYSDWQIKETKKNLNKM